MLVRDGLALTPPSNTVVSPPILTLLKCPSGSGTTALHMQMSLRFTFLLRMLPHTQCNVAFVGLVPWNSRRIAWDVRQIESNWLSQMQRHPFRPSQSSASPRPSFIPSPLPEVPPFYATPPHSLPGYGGTDGDASHNSTTLGTCVTQAQVVHWSNANSACPTTPTHRCPQLLNVGAQR